MELRSARARAIGAEFQTSGKKYHFVNVCADRERIKEKSWYDLILARSGRCRATTRGLAIDCPTIAGPA